MRPRLGVAALMSIVILALASSATSITNGFAFDDVYVIVHHESVHSLTRWWEFFAGSYWPPERGGELYRPLTMLSFAVQWAAGGGNPLPFHITSIVLYAIVCAVFFRVMLALLPLPGAWLAGALFAVHPLHVEAVGNVVGQAELWAALFMFLAIGAFVRARSRGALSWADTAVIALLYALGLLSKEHAIVLPIVLFAAELTVAPRTQALRARLIALRPLLLTLAAIALAFLWVRSIVLADTRGIPGDVSRLLLDQPYHIRLMTMLSVMVEWVRLLLWPARLSADYSPRHIELVTTPTVNAVLGTAVVVTLLVTAIRTRRSAPAVTFGILWLTAAVLIPSNLIIPTGFVLAERTLFVASGAVMLLVAWTAVRFVPDVTKVPEGPRRLMLAGLAGILLAGVVASAVRQRVWKDNETLFAQTVKDVPGSYRARMAYAAVLFGRGQKREGFEQLNIANNLYPDDPALVEFAAHQYALAGSCRVAARLYRSLVEKYPTHLSSRIGLVGCLIVLGDHAGARAAVRAGLTTGVPQTALRQLLHINDSVEIAARRRGRISNPPARR